ncbi:MAG: hypothetical protein A3205_03485 [Methanomassiliicoccales archaeon Mx-03]|nr:MAG: hypothetical protein A3205_03485 [Methanomassiliicoccales archaeon Mx-03]
MGNLACDMIEKSVQAIVDGNVVLADEVIDDFARMDRYDVEIEDAAIRILTLYQPTASDTRTIATILKSITYLERIGKYSYNIATATKYLSEKPMFEPVHLIQPVGEVAVRMVKIVTKAFDEKTVEGLDKISEMDDFLDKTMREDLIKIVDFINENEQSADVCTYYISVIKYLERVGDHACKMAEKVNFMVTGMRARIE